MKIRRLESAVENDVCLWAEVAGLLVFKFTPKHNAGWPDRMFIGPQGQVAFIEFKAVGEEPTLQQAWNILQLSIYHVPVLVTSSYDEAVNFLKGVFRVGSA